MSYWQVPDDVIDDPERLAVWATRALAAARRAKDARKPAKRRRRRAGEHPAGRG